MSRPTKIDRASGFRKALREYKKVFALFYHSSDPSARVLLPIFEFSCEEKSTPLIAFVKVDQDEIPGLAIEYSIPQELTVAAFADGKKLDCITSPNKELLRKLVSRYADDTTREVSRSSGSESRSPSSSKLSSGSECDSKKSSDTSRTHESVSDTHSPKHSPSRTRLLPLHIRLPKMNDYEYGKYYPVRLNHVRRFGPVCLRRIAKLEYEGQDGQVWEASIHLERRGSGAGLTYLDCSGPIAVERDISI